MSCGFAAIGDAIADFKLGDSGMLFGDVATAGVSNDRVLVVEFRLGFANRRQWTKLLHHVENHLDARLADLRGDAASMNRCRLGAARNERRGRTYEHMVRRCDGIRNLVDNDLLHTFSDDLFHAPLMYC